MTPLGWWSLSGEVLMDTLRRAHNGEDPGTLYAELYANSDVSDYGREDDDSNSSID